jgi:uncharacterized protein
MNQETISQILKIYVGESDRINGRPLYEEIVFEARKQGLAGATAYKGLISFGASHSIHSMKNFALSGDLPVIVEIVDSAQKIREFLDVINNLMDICRKGGLVTVQPVEVIRYRKGQKYLDSGS